MRNTTSLKPTTVTKSIRKRTKSTIGYGIFNSSTNGFDLLQTVSSEDKYASLMQELKQFILSRNLQKSSWKESFLVYFKEGTNDFPFEDNEFLHLAQAYTEELALKRLLQFLSRNVRRNIPFSSCSN